jgi:hypothetical protein
MERPAGASISTAGPATRRITFKGPKLLVELSGIANQASSRAPSDAWQTIALPRRPLRAR